jgi:hypothetical protein
MLSTKELYLLSIVVVYWCLSGMSVLNKIAFYQNRRDEVPNQQLAKELAEAGNKASIAEIAQNLNHKNKSVQSDCLKVLYEIGYLKPDLIADYVQTFLDLLKSKTNRVVWGTKTLAKVAATNPTYNKTITPYLMTQLKKCIPRDVAMHAEHILPAINADNKQEFLSIIEARKPELSPAQLARLKRVTKTL